MNISAWSKSFKDGCAYWTKGKIRYCDSNNDGKIESKKIGLFEDGGILWVDTDNDGFFDSAYKVTDQGDVFLEKIYKKVPATK